MLNDQQSMHAYIHGKLFSLMRVGTSPDENLAYRTGQKYGTPSLTAKGHAVLVLTQISEKFP